MRRLFTVKMVSLFMSALALAGLVLSVAPLATVNASPAQDNAEGGIQLQIINPPAGAPWVGVQYQDPAGAWYNVDGWVGPLDPTQGGYVTYWVDPKDFGKGPFRWVVWDKQGGKVLATSATFYFPTYATIAGSLIDLSTPTPVAPAAAPVSLGMAQDNAEGGIQLQILNPPAATPWVVVQYQDLTGTWREVSAWAGPLDPTQGGYVTYWIDPKDFGKGPFRWVVLDKQGGKVLATSATFYFPSYATTVGSTLDLSTPAQ